MSKETKVTGALAVAVLVGKVLGLIVSAAFLGWLVMLGLGIFEVSVPFLKLWPATAIVLIVVRALFPTRSG